MSDRPRSQGLAFVAICLGFFAVILDTTIVNVALPAIERSLGGTVTALQWVVNGYNLFFAALLLTAGAISDRRGGKRTFAVGLAIFVLGSLLCGVAPSLTLLVTGRIVQGVGAALLMPASLTLIAHNYPDAAQRTRAIGAWAAVAGAATAIGPVLGGLLVDTLGWRAIFLVNLPIGAIAIVMLLRHATETAFRRRSLDLAGQILGIAFLGSTAGAITEAGPLGWSSRPVVILMIVAVVTAIAFIVVERAARSPMLPPGLLKHRTFSAASTVGALMNFGIYGQVFVLSLYFQHMRGDSALATGVFLLPFAVMTMIGPPLTGRLTARYGPRVVMTFGQITSAAGTLILSRAVPTTSYGYLAVGLCLLGIGMAATMPSLTAAVMLSAPRQLAGIASGVLNAARQSGGVLGVALLGTLISNTTHFTMGMHTALSIVTATFLLGTALAIIYVRKNAAEYTPSPPATEPAAATTRGN